MIAFAGGWTTVGFAMGFVLPFIALLAVFYWLTFSRRGDVSERPTEMEED